MSDIRLSNLEQQAVALAGVAQAARLVDQISKTGSYPLEFLEPSIHSLFVFSPDSAVDLFKGISGVKLGLHNLSNLLADKNAQENHDLVRYVFSLLYLERKFAANPDMMAVVRARLEHNSFRAASRQPCKSAHPVAQITPEVICATECAKSVGQEGVDSTASSAIRALASSASRSEARFDHYRPPVVPDPFARKPRFGQIHG